MTVCVVTVRLYFEVLITLTVRVMFCACLLTFLFFFQVCVLILLREREGGHIVVSTNVILFKFSRIRNDGILLCYYYGMPVMAVG